MTDLVEKNLTNSVLGAFYHVYKRLEYGYLEGVYSNALAIELRRRGHRVRRGAGADLV